MSSARNRVFGVDFSGEATPGQNLWITEATPDAEQLEIVNICSAVNRFNLSKSTSRDNVYTKLRELVRDHSSAVFGFDFPFSLAEPLLSGVNSWEDHLETFTERFDVESATAFRQSCVEAAEEQTGDSGYLRRETDWRYAGQCPYQHQLVYQSYHGQRDLLAPLILHDEAKALPMQSRSDTHAWLIEVYPAATLSKLELYRQGYKNQPHSPSRREQNIEGLRKQGVIISDSHAKTCRDNDNAHDSLTAAVATHHALESNLTCEQRSPNIEGRIFA